jgi:hypothetical protein
MSGTRFAWRSTLLASRAGAALLASLAAALLGCSSTSVRLNRDYEDPADAALNDEAQSPEAFVDRLGEPDEWKNEGEGDDLRQTAVWKCRDGQDRTITWRLQESQKGVRRWVVVSDTSRKGDCAGGGTS